MLNILFKHSKKKILFKWDYEVENGYSKGEKREYTIGINTAGLGLSSHYEHSLRNITDYYAKDNFSKLFKNPEFVKKLLGCVKKDKAKIIPNLLTKDKNDFEKKIEVGKVLITIKNHLNYNNKDYVGYRSEIEIIDKKIQPFKIKEDDSDYYLSEISDLNLELSLKDLLEFSWLLNSKDKVIIKLQEELKNYHLIKKEIDKKTAVVDKELKPYEALEQI